MNITRKRFIVMRNNRSEVWCGLSKHFYFKPVSEVKDTSVKTYRSQAQAEAGCSSWDRNFEVVPATETIVIDPVTNADRIRAMSDEELAEFIRGMVDGSYSHPVACYGCINYGTHHSDPANKGTYLYECEGCTNEGIGLDVLMWLQQPAEEDKNGV